MSAVGARGLPARAGKYELLSLLGRGGMGSVYLGREATAAVAPLVAINVPHAHLTEGAAETMLEDEARVLAHIVDPHVVPLVALERSDEGLLFVMPFVPGVTAAVLAKSAAKSGKPIPLPVVLRIVCDALSGLKCFVECIEKKQTPVPGGLEGLANMRVVDAAYESNRTGKVVQI